MDLLTNISVVLVAISPWVCLAAVLLFGWMYHLGVGIWLGCGALYLPLGVMLLPERIRSSAGARLALKAAGATCLLLLIGAVLLAAPNYVPGLIESSPTSVTCKPTSGVTKGIVVSGLNTRFDPILYVEDSGVAYHYRLLLTNPLGEEKCRLPHQYEDGFGNTLDFRLTDDGVHIQDNLGGFANFHWDGNQLLLDDSQSMGKSASALMPSHTAREMHRFGEFLLLIAPFIAWLCVAIFVRRHSAADSRSTAGATISIMFQVVGISIMLLLFAGVATHILPPIDMSPIRLRIAYCWWAFSAIGLAILTGLMLVVPA
jgi:hypothetical protein